MGSSLSVSRVQSLLDDQSRFFFWGGGGGGGVGGHVFLVGIFRVRDLFLIGFTRSPFVKIIWRENCVNHSMNCSLILRGGKGVPMMHACRTCYALSQFSSTAQENQMPHLGQKSGKLSFSFAIHTCTHPC